MALVQIYFELLNLIPIPWQVSAFIFFSTLLLYWATCLAKLLIAIMGKTGMKLTEWVIRLLLLPEFLITAVYRDLNLKSAFGIGTYDDFIETIGREIYKLFDSISRIKNKELHYPTAWVLLMILIPVIAWYLYQNPDLKNSLLAQYIKQGFSMYYSLQHSVLP